MRRGDCTLTTKAMSFTGYLAVLMTGFYRVHMVASRMVLSCIKGFRLRFDELKDNLAGRYN